MYLEIWYKKTITPEQVFESQERLCWFGKEQIHLFVLTETKLSGTGQVFFSK